MQYQQTLDLWLDRATEDPDLIPELESVLKDPDAVADRFYRDLEFGTGGPAGRHRRRHQPDEHLHHPPGHPGPGRLHQRRGSARAGGHRPRQPHQEASCLPARRPGCWPPTASPPSCIPGWSPPRRCPGRCGTWAAARASASPPATTPPSTTATRSTVPTAARSRWRPPPRCWPPSSSMTTSDDPKLADYDKAVAEGDIRFIDDRCLSDFVDAVLALRPGNDVSRLKLVYTPLNGTGLEAGQDAVVPHGGDRGDGGAGAGTAGRPFPHLPLPQPGDPPGHGVPA